MEAPYAYSGECHSSCSSSSYALYLPGAGVHKCVSDPRECEVEEKLVGDSLKKACVLHEDCSSSIPYKEINSLTCTYAHSYVDK